MVRAQNEQQRLLGEMHKAWLGNHASERQPGQTDEERLEQLRQRKAARGCSLRAAAAENKEAKEVREKLKEVREKRKAEEKPRVRAKQQKGKQKRKASRQQDESDSDSSSSGSTSFAPPPAKAEDPGRAPSSRVALFELQVRESLRGFSPEDALKRIEWMIDKPEMLLDNKKKRRRSRPWASSSGQSMLCLRWGLRRPSRRLARRMPQAHSRSLASRFTAGCRARQSRC